MRTWLTQRMTAAAVVMALIAATPLAARAQQLPVTCPVLNCLGPADGNNDNPVAFTGTVSIGKSVTLTNADVLALSTTPYTIVAAPPSGYYIDVIGVTFAFHYVGAYTGGSNIKLFWTNRVTGNAASSVLTVSGFLTGVSADQLVKVAGVPDGEAAPTTSVPLVLEEVGNITFGGGNAANTVTVTVEYRITKTGL